jgi:hypothetical protein
MRIIGTSAFGLRLPIISPGEELIPHIIDAVENAIGELGKPLSPNDIIAVTEALVAKSENNYADIADIGADIKQKFPGGELGLVFPILSRNRFLNILKGVALGVEKLHILLSFPHDEVGNPVFDLEKLDEVDDFISKQVAGGNKSCIPAAEFRKVAGEYKMPFTGVDYVQLYESVGKHISVYFSNDPRAILEITPHVLVAEIHNRHRTKKRLEKAGAKTVHTLSDILNKPVNSSGHNSLYGVLGSNLSTQTKLKLFPNNAPTFVENLKNRLAEKFGTAPEVMVYGDGAFKDPVCGIWELADPVVSPGHTPRLAGQPAEIKIKMVADTEFAELKGQEKRTALTEMIKNKPAAPQSFREGTTPRVYADLAGSLSDLISGSGDKGTPVVLIRGYFDNYATQ